MRGCAIVNFFTESRKVYGVVFDRAINFELRYSEGKAIKRFKNHEGFLDITLSTKIFPI